MPATLHPMKAIIFDMDGVLVDSEILYQQGERDCLHKIGLTYDPAIYRKRFMGISGARYYEELDKDHIDKYGLPVPDSFKDDLKTYCQTLLDEKLEAVAHTAGFLEKSNRPMAVASSSSLNSIRTKLTKTGLINYFGGHLYSSEMVDRGKPDPDIYLMAADKLKTPPRDCIVIEDSENGVLAGVRAGMTVIAFTGGSHYIDKSGTELLKCGASFCVENYADLSHKIFG